MKRAILALLALSVGASAAIVEARETPRERREREAKAAREKINEVIPLCQKAYEEQRWDDVIKECSKVIDAKALEPADQGSILLMRGTAQQKKDDCAKAMPDFDAAQPLRPQDFQVPFLQYICAVKLKDDAKAASSLDAALALAPDNADLLRARCVSRINAKAFAAAIPDCEKVVAAKPDDTDIWLALGQVYETEKQTDKARAAYTKVLALSPGNASASDGIKRLGAK
jgi:Flp pilus assembly protein TadD